MTAALVRGHVWPRGRSTGSFAPSHRDVSLVLLWHAVRAITLGMHFDADLSTQ